MTPPSAGIYVHLPFCRVRCSYCPFAITTATEGQERYMAAVERELAERLPAGAAIDTIYVGGGTPSRVDPQLVLSLAAAIRSQARIADGAEFTLEANPEDVSERNLSLWRDAGVNRLSIGIQSVRDDELRASGRVHGGEAAVSALELAVASGLRVSADLIIGLPGQSRESFEQSLREVLEAGAGHLSTYLLDLEEGTPLHRQVVSGRTVLADDDQLADSYLHLVSEAARHGLTQYEISNFAREGEHSRHNLRYWLGSPYIGAGVSAHSFDGATRSGNVRDVDEYVRRIESGESPVDFSEEIDTEVARRERIFLGLRQTRGLAFPELQELASADAAEWWKRGVAEGWLAEGPRVAFTPRGFLLSTSLIAELF